LAISSATLNAQQRVRLGQDAAARADADPSSAAVTTVVAGTEILLGTVRGASVQATFEGYIWAGSVRRQGRTSRLKVTSANGENLRIEPNVRVVAKLPLDFPLELIERQGGWSHVRATAWFDTSAASAAAPAPPTGRSAGPAVTAAPPPVARPAPPPGGDTVAQIPAGDSAGVSLDRGVLARAAPLHRVPDGPTSGTLQPEAPVRILARSGDWVRVQTEGWILASDVRPGGGVMVGVSGAEVRARPDLYEGKLVQWNVQFIAIQTADELRHDIPAGRRYVLARGPTPEAGFVYLLATEQQLRDIAQLSPLAEIVVVGKVRVARSQYLGNPILDLVDLRALQ
jgi:hypothetical protein